MDVLLVALGSTTGLRRAEDALAASLERAGASVAVARAAPQPDVRTLAHTDLRWALAARRAAQRALGEHDPRAVLYYTTTAALLWPRPGAVRYDALAADNRPGRHGVWQRPLERRRLRQAQLVIPSSADVRFPTGVVVPPAVDPSGPSLPRSIAAITYAANPEKKGLDRVLRAWHAARRDGEELVVAGLEGADADGVRYAGRLGAEAYRALLRRARAFVCAPRWEDFGIAQLEALADGCRLVTTYAPGPYAALPLARALDARLVARDETGLAAAIRVALDDPDGSYAERAMPLVAPYATASVDALVADRLLPALLR
ncbi:MAG: glycosyltransferase family 4 protein [Solirubrobacterales bacterium]|nr:glycosyltransferase family 4 protein [Solirubrobacterales bacterium]